MGAVKQWMLEQEERGYSEADGEICAECVADDSLAEWIGANVCAPECTFCGATSDLGDIAASFDDFVGIVLGGISFDWRHPDAEGIMYISAEGGYQAPISDTGDVFAGILISENDKVIEALEDSIENDGWVPRDFYRGDDAERLTSSWQWFKHVVKHRTRFVFLEPDEADQDEEVPPSGMLATLASMITGQPGPLNLVRTVAAGTNFLRVRVDLNVFHTAAEIGPPPLQYALQANRMSPAGIPMFYGALNAETAIAETLDPNPAQNAGKQLSIGTFTALRDLRLLDLTDLPELPSVFDAARRELIHPLRFLHDFARDIALPIRRDGAEHIEYVPTQVVTEYFRRVFRDPEGQPLDGLQYQSARRLGQKAVVLFAENDQCVDGRPGTTHRKKLLGLIAVEHRPADVI